MTKKLVRTYSSSESEFNDDSDIDDELSAINDWVSGAETALKSSQFTIDGSQDVVVKRQDTKKSNADVLNQIDQVMTNGDQLSDGVVDKKSVAPSKSFHELIGTAVATDKPPTPPQIQSKLNKMKKMSILGRKTIVKNPRSKKIPRNAFEKVPQSAYDYGDTADETPDSSNHNRPSRTKTRNKITFKKSSIPKRNEENITKPDDVDSIASQYMFSNRLTKTVSQRFNEEDYDDILAKSNAILDQTGGNGSGQDTVMFTYDEELHDFVPTKPENGDSGSGMKQWWKSHKPGFSSSNKNIKKMVRFSSDDWKYRLKEDDTNKHPNGGHHSMTPEGAAQEAQNRRAAITFIVFSFTLALIMVLGLSMWTPWGHREVEWEVHETPPDLDYSADGDDKLSDLKTGVDGGDIIDANKDSQDHTDASEETFHDQPEKTKNPTITGNYVPLPSPVSSPSTPAKPLLRDDIFEIIQQVSSKESILKSGTIQYKASAWLAEADPAVLSHGSDLTANRIIQRFVLANIYYSLNGDSGWAKTNGWLTEKHECEWYGISCSMDEDLNPSDEANSNGSFITGIDLTANGLKGSLPTEIASLNSLSESSMHSFIEIVSCHT